MKKLYLFGDSFSLFNTDMKDVYKDVIEFNAHSSLSNEHILKLVKKKLLKLSKDPISSNHDLNIFVQLTVSTRMLVTYTTHEDIRKCLLSRYGYFDSLLTHADKDLFKNKEYYTIYPNNPTGNIIMDMIYRPYMGSFLSLNETNILPDLLLEINVLKQFANKLGIKFDYIFYSNNFDKELQKVDSDHIQFYGHHSVQSYIQSNHSQYFVSSQDIHFNDEGKMWYLKWLTNFYDI
jgi:hypothetical protein